MNWYQKAKNYYIQGLWTESQVRDCYLKGKITESQLNEILSYKKS